MATIDDYWTYAEAPNRSDLIYDPETWGKWLIFYASPDHAQLWWEIVSASVMAGQLGPSAKIPAECPHVPIVVYTSDWRDRDDVRRVLRELRHIGIKGRLMYKTDAATLRGEYGRGASLYVSQPGSDDFTRQGNDD